MAGVPTNFQAISNVLANYNFVDIASGTGYVLFYAGSTVDKKLLSNFTYYSDGMTIYGTTTNVAYTLVSDTDYDVLLNRPLDLKGIGIVNVPLGLMGSGSAAKTYYSYVTITLRKYNGAESDIIANDSRAFSVVGNGGSAYAFSTLSVDLDIPLTHFKIGETLRLTIQCYARNNDASTDAFAIVGQDPKNRTSGWDSTGAVPSQLIFQCPVRLNL